MASLAADLDLQLVGLAAVGLDYREFVAFVDAGLPGMNIVVPAAGVAYMDHAGTAFGVDARSGTEEQVAAVTSAAGSPYVLVAADDDRAPVVLAELDTETAVAAQSVGAAAAVLDTETVVAVPSVGAAAAAQLGRPTACQAAQKPQEQEPAQPQATGAQLRLRRQPACHTESRSSQDSSSRAWRRRLALSRAPGETGHQGRIAGPTNPRQPPHSPCPRADLKQNPTSGIRDAGGVERTKGSQ